MSTVAIVDYGMGNLDSVARAIEEVGGYALRTDDPRDLKEATHIVLPGVGAFGDAMEQLRRGGWIEALEEQVRHLRIPLLGVCLGMQLLAKESLEGGVHTGLGWIDAEVRLFQPTDSREHVPHVGWNNVCPVRANRLFESIEPGRDFYFVHSYHVVCADRGDVLATTPYDGEFVSVVNRGNVYGAQFHPEKSQDVGLQFLSNFLALQEA